MAEIIQLSTDLANKIAAGEVVERPASVVKELVENAIDAKSSIIDIEIEEAGLKTIRVVDNGKGISSSDIVKAFERHATSKIKNDRDLFRIRSLGFRGEALPSIASVSRLTMLSCEENAMGTIITIEGSQVSSLEKGPSRRGTDITVRDLFYNTPARLKYVRSIHTELGHITDIVNRLALAHPKIAFQLTNDGRELLRTNGNGDVRQVISAIYSFETAKKMLPLKASSLDFEIDGYISLPEINRASRNYISLMINGRFIKSYPLAKSIAEGYHTLLPIGRHPIVVLNIKMDPILVDVNVHPTKLEVRFSKEAELKELITSSIKKLFEKQVLIPEGRKPAASISRESEQQALHLEQKLPEQEVKSQAGERVRECKKDFPGFSYTRTENEGLDNTEVEGFRSTTENHHLDKLEPADQEDNFFPNQATSDKIRHQNDKLIPQLYPIGQMHGTYIFAQNEHGLYMIDQHAAQERIYYEFFKGKITEEKFELQQLLLPLTIQSSLDEVVKIEKNKEELSKFGVYLEDFGHNTYIVREHPTWFPEGQEVAIIEEMIDQIVKSNQIKQEKLRDEIIIMMSCKAAIKANHHLRFDEIESLLNELRATSSPFTCPHGRPIIIHYPTYELEKMFKRVM